jgi:hypothetical protein
MAVLMGLRVMLEQLNLNVQAQSVRLWLCAY